MKYRNEREPRIKRRHQVYLYHGKKKYFSKSYKTERGAWAAVERLNKRYSHLGYEARVEDAEEVI